MISLVGMGKMLTPRNVVLGVIGANMVCRPLITLSNRQLPEDTRRYTAMREFCTELFGLFNTLTFTTAVEYLGPRLISKDATRKVISRIKGADWNKLTAKDQRLKAAVLLSSLIGTILSTAILTPLLNNLVLNRLLEKIMGKKTTPEKAGQAEPVYSGILQPGNNPLFDTFAHSRRLTGERN